MKKNKRKSLTRIAFYPYIIVDNRRDDMLGLLLLKVVFVSVGFYLYIRGGLYYLKYTVFPW